MMLSRAMKDRLSEIAMEYEPEQTQARTIR